MKDSDVAAFAPQVVLRSIYGSLQGILVLISFTTVGDEPMSMVNIPEQLQSASNCLQKDKYTQITINSANKLKVTQNDKRMTKWKVLHEKKGSPQKK